MISDETIYTRAHAHPKKRLNVQGLYLPSQWWLQPSASNCGPMVDKRLID